MAAAGEIQTSQIGQNAPVGNDARILSHRLRAFSTNRYKKRSHLCVDSKAPEFRDWLSAQTDREDLIGALARLATTSTVRIKEIGFDSWISELSVSQVLSPEVEAARAEYLVCVAEITNHGHSKSFPAYLRSGPGDGERAAVWAKHKSSPNVSVQAHLHQIHKDLRKKVDAVQRLYLDTCHWIGLREVELGRSVDRSYVSLLSRLRKLKAENRILCPFSYPIIHELSKQTDDKTRRTMAAIIDELSDGVCIQPPNQIERIELKRQILASVLGPSAPDAGEWVWTKAAFAFGEMIFEPTAPFPLEQKILLQKVLIDTFWDSKLLAVVEFHSGADSTESMQELADAYNSDSRSYRENRTPFDRVLMEEKAIHVKRLLDKELVNLGSEVGRQFPKECEDFAARQGSVQRPDPAILPSIQIKSGVHASFIVSSNTMKLKPNDLIDALHASMALPYFNGVLLEKPLALRLKTPPLEFGRKYHVYIDWNVDSFLTWLADLTVPA